MVQETIVVGIVVERRKLSSPWLDHVWLPVAVLPGAPAAAAWTLIEPNGESPRYYAGSHAIHLHAGDTAQHRDNLASGEPRVWIAARPTGAEPPHEAPLEIVGITVDSSEGEAYTAAGDDIVEAVPMPPDIAARVAAFVAANHVERPFFKRKRERFHADEPAGQRPSSPRREPDHGR
jgi:hypothetical protein